ncbi:hypothetical protein K2X85_14890 [bacterium]|nr:hypothetical protein [bacterium]
MTTPAPQSSSSQLPGRDLQLVVGASSGPDKGPVTARVAGGMADMELPVGLAKVSKKIALENLAKAINLALQSEFLETPLDGVYKAARVRKGAVEILHGDYIGLGDGVMAKVGKSLKSMRLTFVGPDPASPEGKALYARTHDNKPLSGLINLLGRKLNLLQEFEDKVPMFIEQMLDRLEASRVVTGWTRSEWDITTETIGLDATIRPCPAEKEPA